MDKIKRFFECLIPVTVCNLECHYCYVIQEHRRSMKLAELKYTPEHMAQALRKERVGGTCLISICGAGETLAQREVIDIVAAILSEGHYVNITTNGTLSQRFDELIEKCKPNIKRLHISFSMHYLELVKLNLLERFFDNIDKVRRAGASFMLQINLCDEYIPYIEEIKKISYEKVGAYPQVALTRNEETVPMSIHSKLSNSEYYKYGSLFESPLFDFTFKNFNVKRKEFCYAGDWSGILDLQTGILKKCYNEPIGVNIFEDIDKPICFEAVGSNCKSCYCVNSSHFMSLGVIPEISTPTYAQLRNRVCSDGSEWLQPEIKSFMSTKLFESNEEYSKKKKRQINKAGEELIPFSVKVKSAVYKSLPENIAEKIANRKRF
ncbi:MAG: radical SAM protein [Clostridia bacterium]|nr:radical SAM protein [Clostridia bacterium]